MNREASVECAQNYGAYKDVIVEVKISVVAKEGSVYSDRGRTLTRQEGTEAGPIPKSPKAIGYLMAETCRRLMLRAQGDLDGWEDALVEANLLEPVGEKKEAGQGGSC